MLLFTYYFVHLSAEISIRVFSADRDEQIKLTRPLEALESGAEASDQAGNMDEPRDVQTSKRTGSSGTLVSAGSSMAMEVKRKKIRQCTLFQQAEVVSSDKTLLRVLDQFPNDGL